MTAKAAKADAKAPGASDKSAETPAVKTAQEDSEAGLIVQIDRKLVAADLDKSTASIALSNRFSALSSPRSCGSRESSFAVDMDCPDCSNQLTLWCTTCRRYYVF